MSEDDTTDTNDTKQLQIVPDPPFTYSPDETNAFIDKVFPPDVLEADEFVLTYTSNTNIPGFPCQETDSLNKVMTRSTKAKAMYVNTATGKRDDDGTLAHKKGQFVAMYFIVFDDIGTKIPIENLPAELIPTYIIESSPDNYQYGYVFNSPIEDYELARSVLQTAAEAGLTDSGGLMPNKVVRLPDGVNGKDDPVKRLYPVTMVSNDGPFWDVEQFIDTMDCHVDGEKVTWQGLKDGTAPIKVKSYSNAVKTAEAGVLDPVVQWLSDESMLINDGDDWHAIVCPWAEGHTSGSDSAGYSPLGKGDMPNFRGFKCQHDHCKSNDTKKFLQYVLANSGFEYLAQYEGATVPIDKYAFDQVNNQVWDIDNGRPWKMEGFRNTFNQTINVIDSGGKGSKMSIAQYWLHNPYCLTVRGAVAIPNKPKICEMAGEQMINTYRPPPWTDGVYDQHHIDKFIDFINYLLPNDDERDYFLDWLSAKVQNPVFRGTAIMMVAQVQGIGRTTLANMLFDLLGHHNCTDVPFDVLVSPKGFNHWADKLFVAVSEAREVAQDAAGGYKAYESLKLQVDTNNRPIMMNTKYQAEKNVLSCSSFLILTNHEFAIRPPKDDRRLTVLKNAMIPRSPDWFVNDLLPWIGAGDWTEHVYRWLRGRDVDLPKLSRPLNTVSKTTMVDHGENELQYSLRLAIEYLISEGHYFINGNSLKLVMSKLGLDCTGAQWKYAVAAQSLALNGVICRINGVRERPRVISAVLGSVPEYIDGCESWPTKDIPARIKDDAKAALTTFDEAAVYQYVLDNREDV